MPRALLATDGSERANRALRAGLDVIGDTGRLVLVTVVPAADPSLVVGAGHSGPVMSPDEKQRLMDANEAEGNEVLTAAAALLAPAEVEPRLLYGDAGHEICRCAGELGVEVIVLGTSGRGGLKRAVLGSVSDHVVRHAPCPVLTIGETLT